MGLSWRTRIDILSLEKEGKNLLNQKKWVEAENVFSKLLDCGEIFWVYLAESLLGQKKYKSAKECFDKILPKAELKKSWSYEAFKKAAYCLLCLGDIDSAQEYLNKALLLNKDGRDPEINLIKGLILKENKKYSLASENFQKILEKDSKNDEAWAQLAEIRSELGDFEMAYVNLQQALDLNPENESALKVKIRWSASFQQISGRKQIFSFHI